MLTQKRLKEVLDYDPITGVFIWKNVPTNNVKAGSVAGCEHPGGRQIRVDGTMQQASRLAYLWVTGNFPKHRMYRLNGDNDSTVWGNLAEMNGLVGNTGRGNHHTGSVSKRVKVQQSKPIRKTGPGGHRYQHAKYMRDMKCRHQLELIDTQIAELAIQRIAVLAEMAAEVVVDNVVPKRSEVGE